MQGSSRRPHLRAGTPSCERSVQDKTEGAEPRHVRRLSTTDVNLLSRKGVPVAAPVWCSPRTAALEPLPVGAEGYSGRTTTTGRVE